VAFFSCLNGFRTEFAVADAGCEFSSFAGLVRILPKITALGDCNGAIVDAALTDVPVEMHFGCVKWLPLRTFQIAFLFCQLKRKKPARQKEKEFHHNVYVVLLKDTVAKHPSILRLNPKRDPLKPCVYVGMTGIPVDHRFENHKNGYKSAWVVRKYGVRLMPELYEHLNPMPFEAAVQMEGELAEDLRVAGYTVTGGH